MAGLKKCHVDQISRRQRRYDDSEKSEEPSEPRESTLRQPTEPPEFLIQSMHLGEYEVGYELWKELPVVLER